MTKRILAVLLALTMVLSLCSFEAFAEDSAEKDLVVVWELAAPVEEIGSKTAKDLFGDQFEDFIKAINTEGAVLEFTVTNSSSDGMMTNIFTNVDDWSNAYVCDSGYPTGTKTFTVAAADLMEHGGITEITNLRFQFGVYKKDEIKIALNSAEVMVPMSAEEPKEPEGTKLEMARNGDWNWKADVAWEAVEASLKDITPEALAKIESIEVSLTVTGAIVDGETIDASKVGANLVIQGKWEGWHSVDATAKDGVLTATIKPGDFALEEDDVNAYQVISQLTIGPDDLPNGLEGTKEGAVYYKDAKVTITEKPEEKKPEGYTVEVVKSEKTVEGNVITADVSAGNVQTDGLLVSFENGAPTAGTVKVIYEGEETSGGDAPATYEEVPSLAADKFAADRLDSDGVITFNAAWSDCPSIWIGEGSDITGYDSIELVIDSVSNYTQFQVQYTDGETQNVVLAFGSAGTYTADLDPTKTILQVYVQGGTEGGTVKISSIKFRKAPVADPDANAVTVEFEEGKKYVEITGLDSTKKIKEIQVTFEEGAEITADVLTKIEAKAVGGSSGLPPFFPNQFYPGDGYVVTLDDQFHAFSFNGVLIPLYHEFNAAGFCTICGYYKAPAAADEVVVTTPTEPGDQDSQEEVDEPGDDITVDDTEETKEENPKTGLSLAVLPMILAAAAVVTGRKH